MPFLHDADPLHDPPSSSPDPARRVGPRTLTTLQRSAGNRATGRLLRQVAAAPNGISRRPVGEPGVAASAGYAPGEKEASRGTPGGVEETPEGTLLFDFAINDPVIKGEHEAKLRQMFSDLHWDRPDSLFPITEIIGFTDAVRRRQGSNTELRLDRADSVQAFLEMLGAHPSNLGAIAAAPPERFLATNDTIEGRARNRSVVIATDAFLPPDPPPTPEPEDKAHTEWFIGEVGSIQPPLEPGVSVNVVRARIREKPPGTAKFAYAFVGGGPGLGVDLGDIKKLRKVIQVILKAISALAIDFDALTGDEHEFETLRAVGKSDFFGLGLILHVDAGPEEIQRVGLRMDTKPAEIDLGGPQLAIGVSAGAETGVWIPLMDLQP
jgi:outer membrane protein OmpA-like peptidoglycan-associated protein